MENKISFKSQIRLATPDEFRKIAGRIGCEKFVDYPWTIKQSVFSDSAYTKNVFDCTVCGITDGKNVLLTHICPTVIHNSNFSIIKDYIKSKINLKNPDLQGFLLGSVNDTKNPLSRTIFMNFANFLENCKIPYSKFKGSRIENNIAYCASKDEWVISNPKITLETQKDTKGLLNNIFEEIEICDLDTL